MNRKLKVMHMIWSMGDGGAQRVVLNYLRDFKNDPDIELKLYVYASATDSVCDEEIKAKAYNVEYLKNPHTKMNLPLIKRIFNPHIARKTWTQALLSYQPDIVHVHISALLDLVLEPIVNAGIPLRFDTLHSDPMRYKGRLLRTNQRAFCDEKFIALCLTKEQAKIAKSRYGFSKYEILRNGVDFGLIRSSKTDKESARDALHLPRSAFIVLGVGRLNPIKNFSLLIEAFSYLHKKIPSSVLAIAGRGKELQHLKKMVTQMNLQSQVYFLGNRNDMVCVYSAADVLGVTSISESSSLAALEAQALGLRCVISDGVPDESIITDHVKKMHANATADEWADALADAGYCGSKVCCEEDYEVHSVSAQLKNIYLRYWKELHDGK